MEVDERAVKFPDGHWSFPKVGDGHVRQKCFEAAERLPLRLVRLRWHYRKIQGLISLSTQLRRSANAHWRR